MFIGRKIHVAIFAAAVMLFLIGCGASTTEVEPDVAEESSGTESGETVVQSGNGRDLSGIANFPAATIDQALQERPSDYAKGAEDPLVTVFEYGDYQ